jgi:hypothetical protein
MAYLVPRVLIKQEFTQLPVFADAPLAALVFGPQYELHRYAVAEEKVTTAVTHPDDAALKNAYQVNDAVVYSFPNQTAGTYVDKDFVKVHFENARVEYYPSDLGSTTGEIVRVAHPTIGGQYYTNRFKASNLVFKTANDVLRSEDFSNRDISLGDFLVIRDIDASTETTVRVKGLHASKSAASVSTPGSNDDNNIDAQTEDTNDTIVYTGSNTTPDTDAVTVSSGRAYKGYVAKRIVGDTYTIEVTTGGALDEAVFKVTSQEGAFAPKTGLVLDGSDILIVDDTGNNSLKIDFAGIARSEGTALQAGDKWTWSVVAPVTQRTPVVAGTYTGDSDLVYKLTVVRGGPFYDTTNGDVCAKIAVTSDGNDSSSAVVVQKDVNFRVGSYGVLAQFNAAVADGGLILGDVYYTTATASREVDVNIIETYEKLPAALLDNSHDFEIVSMQYPTNINVPAVDPADEDIVNWEVDEIAQTISINPNILTVNSSIVYPGGDTISLNVKSADVYVTYRALVIDNAISIGSVTAADQVEAILGKIDPENPLAQGVYDAALNSNGAPVYFSGVLSNDLSGYEAVLANARKEEYYYGLVPLTFDRAIQDAVIGHVNAMSTPENAKWRVAWISVPVTETEIIYDVQEDNTNWKATITDDPFATGTQYRLVTIDGAKFLTDGIRPTDNLLINFSTSSSGTTVFDRYEIADVRTEETLVLVAGPVAPINVAIKAQIERVFTKDEQIDNLRHIGSDYNNRRVRAVFPPVTKNNGVTKEGFFLAAALAGLRSGVVPHQGLTNTVLLGFTDLTMAVKTYTDIQLNRLAEQGYWICTQSVVGATPYVRHQLTTDSENLNTSEDSITTNVDSISYGLRRALAPYIGKYNIHPGSLISIRGSVFDELSYRSTNTYTVRAGNQLISFEILKLEQNTTFKDRVDIEVKLEVPYPLNFINITLFV